MPATKPQNPSPSTLTPVQAEVVQALTKGATITTASQAVGVHRSTVYNWLKTEPAFQTAMEEARTEYIQTLRDDLKNLSSLSLIAMRDILENPAVPAAVRLRAALAVLRRPDFPVRGWKLPELVNTPDEEKFMHNFALVEMDCKQFRYEQALDKAGELNPPGEEG